MTRLIVDGDINQEQLKAMGKFFVKMYKGKKEHINVFIIEGLENKSLKETAEFLQDIMSGDKE